MYTCEYAGGSLDEMLTDACSLSLFVVYVPLWHFSGRGLLALIGPTMCMLDERIDRCWGKSNRIACSLDAGITLGARRETH